MTAYYNDNDPYCAAWLRNLIAAGHIPAGEVDERDIGVIAADELRGYTQCHFFAGLGGWAYALRLAGWPDARPVWTGSCPCQPFSIAGQRQGDADQRHLWPEFRRLIGERQPAIVFGEQVAGADGRQWLAGVRADLEALGYAVGAADLCAAGVGAPHIRQRLFWVADARYEPARRTARSGDKESGRSFGDVARHGEQRIERVAESAGARLEKRAGVGADDGGEFAPIERDRAARRVEYAESEQARVSGQPRQQRDADIERLEHAEGDGREQRRTESERRGAVGGRGWSDFDIVYCADGKARRIESGSQPLAHGVPNRVGKLRAYGNAIVSPLAAEFIGAFMEFKP